MHNDNYNQETKVLHLVLNEERWDLIKSGYKTEDYRLVNRWSILKFIKKEFHPCFDTEDIDTDFLAWYHFTKLDRKSLFSNYDVVCFHLGYPDIKMSFKIESISLKVGELCSLICGCDTEKYYFVIKLGELIS